MWRVPPMWVGRTVAILASGESMSQPVADKVRAAGLPSIAINDTFRLAPWADMLYAADEQWWNHPNNRDARKFAGLKVCCRDQVAGVLTIQSTGAHGFEPDPGAIRTGGNGGYQAVHIAAHAGAARILLCGFDMRRGTKEHWHGRHPAEMKRTTDEAFARWVVTFESLAAALAARGVDVVNVTPGSALRCFRRARLEDELAASVESASV